MKTRCLNKNILIFKHINEIGIIEINTHIGSKLKYKSMYAIGNFIWGTERNV